MNLVIPSDETPRDPCTTAAAAAAAEPHQSDDDDDGDVWKLIFEVQKVSTKRPGDSLEMQHFNWSGIEKRGPKMRFSGEFSARCTEITGGKPHQTTGHRTLCDSTI